ncbi:unnamed protein product [Owenia fusiformis]|uniref:Uncharacterized protein n=1 Tax=Owenia fusiformis TaxID=6347 RepID=A0A8J1UKP5_OWEFU|nr:unnamed protein product [Owenia fusiformis]
MRLRKQTLAIGGAVCIVCLILHISSPLFSVVKAAYRKHIYQRLFESDLRLEEMRRILSEQKRHKERLEWHRFRPMSGESQLAKELFDMINSTMNPGNCTSAKYLLCEWSKDASWGLGSVIHQFIPCLSAAVATRRVLHINAVTFLPNSWGTYLLPPSDTCDDHPLIDIQDWKMVKTPEKSVANTLRLTLPNKGLDGPKDIFHPFRIPAKFANIVGNHQVPELWMVGQYVRYLVQPTNKLKKYISDTVTNIGFKTPIVGLHIRRGDKVFGTLKEADIIPLSKYIAEIDKHFEVLKIPTKTKKRVFLATDDTNVFNEASITYKQYTFIQLESDKTNRSNFMETLTDMFLLAETDYFIGTFSSNLGRLVHELRQQRYIDGSCMTSSLDDATYSYISCCYLGSIVETKPLKCNEAIDKQKETSYSIL